MIGNMSLSCSDCLSDNYDLLCCEEDAGIFLTIELPEYSSSDLDLELPDDIEEAIARFIDDEGDYMPGFDYHDMFQSQSLDASAREDSILWILKVHAFYRFQPLTVYLSVNYLDRFLSSRPLPQSNGWAQQLLSVACLSLAAKMEEPLVPSLFDIQIEGANFIFEPRSIRRMELLVLHALDWRLRSITPFNFIHYFANKVDSTGAFTRALISRATEIILSIIRDVSFVSYWPSSVAAAAILCAANEIPNLSHADPEKAPQWCIGLTKDKVFSCYKLMQKNVMDYNGPTTPPPLLRQLRTTRMSIKSSSDLSSSSSSLSSKRRKLNNWSWSYEHDKSCKNIKK